MAKIVFIQRYFVNFREGIYDCFQSMGVDFKVLNSTQSRGRIQVHQDKVKSVDYIIEPTHFNINDGVIVFPFLFFSLLKLKPKVIITGGGQNTINDFQVMFYCWLTRKKYIIWDLGRGYQDFGNSVGRRIYTKIYKRVLNGAALLFGYNTSSKKYFESLGMPSEKIVVLNNTADTVLIKKVIENSSKELPEDMAMRYDPNKKYIIFVGTLLPTKRIEDFAEIMAKLKGEYTLLIVGSGTEEYTQSLKELFKDVDCIFLGYKKPEELLPYYSIASFSILPGLGGLSINQAMAYGLPVLCTHADGAEDDVVIEDETGYIYSDIDDAVRYIHLKTDEDWKRMGENAAKLMYGEFSIEKECERIIENASKVANCSLLKQSK